MVCTLGWPAESDVGFALIMTSPLVSILIPAYNAEQWIGETLESALSQSWPNKEIIVVDDGSADGTLRMAQQYAPRGVKVVTQPNGGAAAARNKAFELSRGDYIQWLDADDLLSSQKISEQMALAQSCQGKRTLLSCGWGEFMYRPAKADFKASPLWEDLSPLEWLLRKWENNAHMQTATWLVSRELTTAAGRWDNRLFGDDDGEYFFRVIKQCDSIRFVPGAKVFYRAAGSNRLSYIPLSDKKIRAQFLGMKLQIGYLRSLQDDQRVRAACVHYLQTWLHNFYPDRRDILEEAHRLAREMGGELRDPRFSWKYAWIEKTFGWKAAKRAQVQYNQWKTCAFRFWDRALATCTRPTRAPSL
jgi:glycosyltransferase involved in cell wall biosynthesis